MNKTVTIKVEEKDGQTIISNSYGKVWKMETNECDYLIASLVGLTMAEFYRDSEYLGREIEITLNVSVRV